MVSGNEVARVEEFLACVRRVQEARTESQSLACRLDETAAAAAAATLADPERPLTRALERLAGNAAALPVDYLAVLRM